MKQFSEVDYEIIERGMSELHRHVVDYYVHGKSLGDRELERVACWIYDMYERIADLAQDVKDGGE